MKAEQDYELTAKLLVRFCGWRWMRDRTRGLCALRAPFSGSEYESSPAWETEAEEAKHLELLDFVPPERDRFSDWKRHGSVKYATGIAQFVLPPLTTSLDACGMLKAALLARGMCLQILIDPPWKTMKPLTEVTIFDGDMRQLSRSIASEYSPTVEALAICRAADAIPEETGT